jgi:hypothetical protein
VSQPREAHDALQVTGHRMKVYVDDKGKPWPESYAEPKPDSLLQSVSPAAVGHHNSQQSRRFQLLN